MQDPGRWLHLAFVFPWHHVRIDEHTSGGAAAAIFHLTAIPALRSSRGRPHSERPPPPRRSRVFLRRRPKNRFKRRGHTHEVSQGTCFHLPHNTATVNLVRVCCDA